MKPLLVILSSTLLALGAGADPGRLLNVAVGTALAQQERGRDEGRGDRDEDRGRGNEDRDREDRDEDRGRGNDDRDREDRDEDRGRGDENEEREDRDEDRGRGNDDRDREDRDEDRGRGNENEEREDRDEDRGRGNADEDREDRDEDRGRGNEDRDNDEDRGRGNDDAGSGGDEDAGRGNDDSNPDVDGPGNEDEGDGDTAGGNNDNGGALDTEIADREGRLAERGRDDERNHDAGALAGRFDLDDTEMFDDDGFLARRGEIIALSSDPGLGRRAAALGLRVADQQPLASLNTTVYRLSVPVASPIDGILARLRADEPDGVFDRNHLYDGSAASRVSSSAAPNTPSRALVSTAAGVSVGLIDTGVDVLHPALRGTHIELGSFVDGSRVLPEAHGTAVVSLLVSPETGVLPGAQLYVAGVFYEDHRGGLLSEAEDLVRALDWLMERRVPVINMSLSGPPNEVLRVTISRALRAGHLIVAAAGNSGPASPPLYPAAYEGVIAVTAVDSKRNVYRRASRGAHIELAALGVDIVAAAPDGFAAYSGTSFASPYVAALAALEHRSLDPQHALAVKENLRGNAMDLGRPGRDDVYGFGLAQPRAIATAAAAR